MEVPGRIQAICIATFPGDDVVYERFYDLYAESEKADIRAAMAETTKELDRRFSNEAVGSYRDGHIVAVPADDFCFYALGTGEYNELILAEVLRAVIVALREILHIKPLNEKALFGHYAQAALIVDAMIKEGIPELLDIPSIVQALSFDFPTLKEAIKGGTTSDEAEETA